jgi:outer membrane receptor for ferrienterochelin and colicin
MTYRVRNPFGRLLGPGAVVVALLSAVAAPLAAQQVTGKIEGTVTDQAGAPLANAQVLLVGTSFGAVANDRGYYFINNVPVGTYTVRTQLIGYAPAEVRGVRVLGGQTLTADVRMQSSAVVVTGITVSAAENPIVPRDQVASKGIIAGTLVDELPVDDVRQVLSLTPGVLETGAAAGVSIRGGRPTETNVYIDGAPVRSTNGVIANMTQVVEVGTNALEEASVTTGALGVEFSDAQSGVISYTTRTGGERLTGAVSYASDEPFGSSLSYGFNRVEASVGGPIPGAPSLRWFVSGVGQGLTSQFRGTGAEDQPVFTRAGVDVVSDGLTLPGYVQVSGECGQLNGSLPDTSALAQEIAANYGYDCQGLLRPMDWSTDLQFTGKLQYSYGGGSSVSLTAVSNDFKRRFTPGTFLDNPAIYRGQHTWNRLAVLNLSHQVSRSAERALAINLNLSWGQDRAINAPLDPEMEADSRSPTGGFYLGGMEFAGLEGLPFPIDEQIIRDLRTNSGTRGIPHFGRSDLELGQAGRINPFGVSSRQGWWTDGIAVAASTLSETRYTGRLVVDWQANRFHRFTLGGDAKKTELAFWSGNLTRQIFMDAYVEDPVQYGLFASDRLDLGDVVLELGLRWDYYRSGALFANSPSRISTHPQWNPQGATDDSAYANSLARVFTEGEGHHTLSPRLRVSFPITDRTGFRLSYSHQVQSPEYTTLLTGINNDLSFTNQNDIFGRDLDFGKTILFEFGVRHAFSQDLVLDVAAYNKDKVSDFAARILPFADPAVPGDTLDLNVLTNRDFGNAKGVDLKLDWRAGQVLNTAIAYTYQLSKNTGSDPFTYLTTFSRQVSGITGDRTLPPEAAQRTNDDRTHSIVGSVALSFPSDWRSGTTLGAILRNVSAFATFRAQSGLPYTPLINQGDGQRAPRLNFGLGGRAITNTLNTEALPWTKNLDLRVTKGFRVGRLDLTAFADVRNLLNFTNTEQVFAETGDVVNAKHRLERILGNPGEGTGEYGSLWNEALVAGVLLPDNTVNLRASCAGWGTPINCESLRRVEARFGDGDGLYTVAEQERALNTFYDAFFGPWSFYAPGRHVRLGVELNF